MGHVWQTLFFLANKYIIYESFSPVIACILVALAIAKNLLVAHHKMAQLLF